jgi:hypothetical protein
MTIAEYFSDKDLHAFVLKAKMKKKRKEKHWVLVTQMMKSLRTNCVYERRPLHERLCPL